MTASPTACGTASGHRCLMIAIRAAPRPTARTSGFADPVEASQGPGAARGPAKVVRPP